MSYLFPDNTKYEPVDKKKSFAHMTHIQAQNW